MTLQQQLDEAKRLLQIKIKEAISEYETITGLRVVEMDVVRGPGYSQNSSKFLGVDVKTQI